MVNVGSAGGVVSMVTASALDAALTLPAGSMAFAVIVWTPSPNVAVEEMLLSRPSRRRCRSGLCRRTGLPCCWLPRCR